MRLTPRGQAVADTLAMTIVLVASYVFIWLVA